MRCRAVVAGMALAAGAPAATAAPPGAVLVLGLDCSDGRCSVGEYGAGFIVQVDGTDGRAHVVTAHHVVRAAKAICVLFDPEYFPRDLAFDIEAGRVPEAMRASVAADGGSDPVRLAQSWATPAGQTHVDFGSGSGVLRSGGPDRVLLVTDEDVALYRARLAVKVEEDRALDLALLEVASFPSDVRRPVLYLADADSLDTGASLRTAGCRCGPRAIAQEDVQGSVMAIEPGLLHYQTSGVAKGFSGGPVLHGGHVVAMNLSIDEGTGTRVRARRGSVIKRTLAGWIDLPRMRIDLRIEGPRGAADGVASVGQDVVLMATAALDPDGQVLAPRMPVHLDVPLPFATRHAPRATLAAGDTARWVLHSPAEPAGPLRVRLVADDAGSDGPRRSLVDVQLEAEPDIALHGEWVEGPRDGGAVFEGTVVPVGIRFTQDGTPHDAVEGEVTLVVPPEHFEITGGEARRPLRAGEPIVWNLEPRVRTVGARLSFAADIVGADRNGKPITVTLPRPVRVGIEEDRATRFYVGFVRYDIREPTADSGLEFELGLKFRSANVLELGVPLRNTVALGFSLDDTWDREYAGVGDRSLIADFRYWAGTGLAIGLGSIEPSVDVGYIGFSRFVDDNLTDSLRADWEKPQLSSVFIRPGVELGFSSIFRIFGAARAILATRRVEYYLQVRFGAG